MPAITLGVMLLAGCTGSPNTSPSFEGPWAAEFATNYALAEDSFTREVLVDGRVSAQEFSEMLDRFTSCLSNHNIVVSDYGFDGSFHTSFPSEITADEAHEATSKCSRSSGEDLIGSLYSWTHRNPQHADENKIMADCLVQSGAVPQGYSASEFADDIASQSFPYTDDIEGPKLFDACQLDPLGLH